MLVQLVNPAFGRSGGNAKRPEASPFSSDKLYEAGVQFERKPGTDAKYVYLVGQWCLL